MLVLGGLPLLQTWAIPPHVMDACCLKHFSGSAIILVPTVIPKQIRSVSLGAANVVRMSAATNEELIRTLRSWATPPVRLGLSGRNSGRIPEKTPEMLSELFLEFPSRVRLGSPKPCNSGHLKPPEHESRIPSPPVRLGTLLFSEVVLERPLRAGHGIPSSTGIFLKRQCKGSFPFYKRKVT